MGPCLLAGLAVVDSPAALDPTPLRSSGFSEYTTKSWTFFRSLDGPSVRMPEHQRYSQWSGPGKVRVG